MQYTSAEQKHKLVVRGLEEVLGGEKMQEILKKRDMKIYWGTAPTGKPHVGYFIPIAKIADFLKAGCEVTVLIADLHAALDSQKASMELIEKRAAYYKMVIRAMLVSVRAPIEKIRFVQGTEYQCTREYVLDMHRVSMVTSVNEAKRAGSEVVKQCENPLLSGLVYPGMQALDEEYLQVDAQFGGVDQRKIFVYAEEVMPKLGYEKRIHLMNGMAPSLSEGKMSSSAAESKIGLEDSNAQIRKKVLAAFCEEKNVERNPVLRFIEKFVFCACLAGDEQSFSINVQKKGESCVYTSVQSMEEDFRKGVIHPLDLKMALVQYLQALIAPVREEILTHKELSDSAYPVTLRTKKGVKPPRAKKDKEDCMQA